MSSSDTTGAGSNTVAAEPRGASAPAAADDTADQDGDAAADPWFTPGPKRTADASPDASDDVPDPAAGGDTPAAWFLPTGRAALLPDSMTDTAADGSVAGADRAAHAETANSSPPWGAESTAAGTPPPWENGPWPGPGDPRQAGDAGPPASSGDPADEAEAVTARRRRLQLGLAGGAGAVVLIVVILVIVLASSGGPASGCGTYPAPVHQAYSRAMADLRSHAPLPVQSAAFQLAASLANSSAAAASQIPVRTALFAMASDLDQAHADMTAHRAIAPALRQHLTADGTALPASCPS